MPDPPAPSGRAKLPYVLAAVVLIAVVAWILRHDPPPGASSPVASADAGAPQAATAKHGAGPVSPPHPGLPALPLAPDDPRKETAIELAKETLAHYLEFSEFPPWSRPADGSQAHLWKWNELPPTGQAFSNDDKGKPISAELVLDKMYAGPGEVITATVRAWSGAYEDTVRKPAELQSVRGELQIWKDGVQGPNEMGWPAVEKVAFAKVDDAAGPRWVAPFTPSLVAALAKKPEDVRFVAWVAHKSHEFPLISPFRYASKVPLVVLDGHADKIEKGSLEVTLGVDVKILGPIMIQATLFDAEGKAPIATYDDFYRPAQLGPQEVKITFFGRAITEAKVDGPYSVRALHGYVHFENEDPPEIFWSHEKPIPTAAYKSTDFSSGEWDSQEKQDKINQYKEYMKSLGGK